MTAKYKRFLNDRAQDFNNLVSNAKSYVENTKINGSVNPYIYMKPFDRIPGNAEYYRQMYFALNLLQTMDLPPGARVLEVGSGSGWLTEILIGLGFTVDAVEPSEDFNRIAQERVDSFFRHYHLDFYDRLPRITFHTTTLEECDLPGNTFDAIIFFAALHHVIDENQALAQCFRLLRPGGVLGVSCEEAWNPSQSEHMGIYEEEMARFGTLENPFTADYLDELLTKHGFPIFIRYHQINGWYPVSFENQTIKQAAQVTSETANLLVAYKSGEKLQATNDPRVEVNAEIAILDSKFDLDTHRLHVKLRLTNTGPSIWLHKPRENGWITIALYQGELGAPGFCESANRGRLPHDVHPRQSIELTITYPIPPDCGTGDWYVDLVSEGYFWFSTHGVRPSKVRF